MYCAEHVSRDRGVQQGGTDKEEDRQVERMDTWGSECTVLSMSPGIGMYHKLPSSTVATFVVTTLPVTLLASI